MSSASRAQMTATILRGLSRPRPGTPAPPGGAGGPPPGAWLVPEPSLNQSFGQSLIPAAPFLPLLSPSSLTSKTFAPPNAASPDFWRVAVPPDRDHFATG